MTIKDLYDWAVKENIEEYDIYVEGIGSYYPETDDVEINDIDREAII